MSNRLSVGASPMGRVARHEPNITVTERTIGLRHVSPDQSVLLLSTGSAPTTWFSGRFTAALPGITGQHSHGIVSLRRDEPRG